MTELKIFKYTPPSQFIGHVRDVYELRVLIAPDGPWFVAHDVCIATGRLNTNNVKKRLEENEFILTRTEQTGPVRLLLNEVGVYHLLSFTKNWKVTPFKEWFETEVLPQLTEETRKERKPMTKELGTYNGVKICFTDDEQINLTHMWKAHNGTASQKPALWLRQDDTRKFLKTLEKKVNSSRELLLKSQKGRYGGTYAHWQIALAYAKYLSPEVHIWCNEVVKTFIQEEQNPDLAVDRVVRNYKKQGKSDAWIERRISGKLTHNKFIKEFARTGAKGDQYKLALGIINNNVLGMSASKYRKKTGVDITRDGMSDAALAITAAVQAVATEALENHKKETGYTNPDEAMKIIGKSAMKFKGIL